MSYTPPNTFAAGTTLTAADVQGNTDALRVYLHEGIVGADLLAGQFIDGRPVSEAAGLGVVLHILQIADSNEYSIHRLKDNDYLFIDGVLLNRLERALGIDLDPAKLDLAEGFGSPGGARAGAGQRRFASG